MDGRSRNGTYSVVSVTCPAAAASAWADSVPDASATTNCACGQACRGKHALEAGFDWNRNVVHYYGVALSISDVDLTDAVHQQKFNIDGTCA